MIHMMSRRSFYPLTKNVLCLDDSLFISQLSSPHGRTEKGKVFPLLNKFRILMSSLATLKTLLAPSPPFSFVFRYHRRCPRLNDALETEQNNKKKGKYVKRLFVFFGYEIAFCPLLRFLDHWPRIINSSSFFCFGCFFIDTYINVSRSLKSWKTGKLRERKPKINGGQLNSGREIST